MTRSRGTATHGFRTGTAERTLELVNLYDLECEAEKVIPKGAFGYIQGGAGDEWTLRENTRAFDDVRIQPRCLAGVGMPRIETVVLGSSISMPVFVPSMAAHGLAHESAERGTARGAAEAGTLFTVPTLSNASLEEIAAAADGPKWFQLYFAADPGVNRELIERARRIGCSAIVFTVDLEWAGNREADRRTGFVFPPELGFPNLPWARGPLNLADTTRFFKQGLTFADLEFLVRESGLPVIVKGVLSSDDASECVARGAAAIQVSNHGGRQLDGVPASIAALPGVVEAVEGRVPVFLDGGVRRGIHVFKALALGARAVAVGRPVLYGLALGGWQGVRSVLEVLRQELLLTMKLAGCGNVDEISRRFLV